MRRIYVSSTFEDLREYREAVYAQLRKFRLDPLAMEDYVAGEARPLDRCVKDVVAADVYLGLFAWRYGYVPEEDNPEGLSITEIEYRTAVKHGKSLLIFLLSDQAPWPPKLMDSHLATPDRGANIKRLRDRLAKDHMVSLFSSPAQLAGEVSAAVHRLIVETLSDARNPAESSAPRRPTGPLPGEAGPALSLRSLETGLARASGVARLEKRNAGPIATGFLVEGKDLHESLGNDLYLATPAHVVGPKEQSTIGLTVGPDELLIVLTAAKRDPRPLRAEELVWSSPIEELDVSLLRLDRQPDEACGLPIAHSLPGLAGHGPKPERPAAALAFSEEAPRVFLIGHPRGGPLAFSIDNCRLLDHDERSLQYLADTHPGSGGSPVFNQLWEVLGIHRLRGELPRLHGEGMVTACQAVSLQAVRTALRTALG
jgi:hypothetical protein